MASDAVKNFAYSTVLTAPSPAASGTSLVVASAAGSLFDHFPFNAVIWPAGVQPLISNSEIVRVTSRSGDTLTITRTQEGTSARTIIAGDQIQQSFTKGMFEGKADTVHTHAESDVTNLVSDLAGKAPTAHTHAQSDITGLVADLAAKAASVHTHAQSDVTGLVAALAAKQDAITGAASTIAALDLALDRALISNGSGKVAVSAVTAAELAFVSGVTSAIQTQLNGKAASSHTHPQSDITNLVSDLAAKQDTITGAGTTITTADLTADRVLISNASGKVAVDSNLTWVPADGLTNLKHSAFGATAAILPLTVVKLSETISGLTLNDSVGAFGLNNEFTINLDGGTGRLQTWGFSNFLNVGGNRDYNYITAQAGISNYQGTGSSEAVTGINAGAYNLAAGTVLELFGLDAYVGQYGGLTTDLFGAHIAFDITNPTTNAYGVYVRNWTDSGVTTLLEGLHIDNLSASPATTKLAINYADKFRVDGAGTIFSTTLSASLPVFTDASKNLVSLTANAALNALLPSQGGNAGKFLTTDATNSSWATISAAPAFSAITAGTNAAALVVGTGGSLGVSGSGTIDATSLGGTAAASYALLANPTFTTAITTPVLNVIQGSLSADALGISHTVTWNNSGIVGPAWKLNVTDTSSNAAALLADLGVGGGSYVSKWKVDKTGKVIQTGGIQLGNGTVSAPTLRWTNNAANSGIYGRGGDTITYASSGVDLIDFASSGIRLFTTCTLSFASSSGVALDLFISREAARHLIQKDSTNANRFSVTNTYTSATSNELFEVNWITSANLCLVGTRKGSGGGSARAMSLITDGAERIKIGAAGEIGVYGSAAVAKQTVTGSRGGNAALADLLTKLATFGVITDSSSA